MTGGTYSKLGYISGSLTGQSRLTRVKKSDSVRKGRAFLSLTVRNSGRLNNSFTVAATDACSYYSKIIKKQILWKKCKIFKVSLYLESTEAANHGETAMAGTLGPSLSKLNFSGYPGFSGWGFSTEAVGGTESQNPPCSSYVTKNKVFHQYWWKQKNTYNYIFLFFQYSETLKCS